MLKTFYRGNLPPLHGTAVILCDKTTLPVVKHVNIITKLNKKTIYKSNKSIRLMGVGFLIDRESNQKSSASTLSKESRECFVEVNIGNQSLIVLI